MHKGGRMSEVWLDIKGFEGIYQVSSIGRVRSLDRFITAGNQHSRFERFIKGRILKPRSSKSRGLDTGYLRVRLIGNGKDVNKCIHKLVAEAFIPNPNNKPQVDHIDSNVRNNCVSNLRWCTQSENNCYRYAKEFQMDLIDYLEDLKNRNGKRRKQR